MSRIGKQPVLIPDKVKVTVNGGVVLVEGPKGKVQKTFAPAVKVSVAEKKVTFAPADESRFAKAMYGTARSVVAGMVKGVTDGYSKDLEIQGVGFKAALKGKQLDLALGYSHPILMDIPDGIKVTVVEGTKVKVEKTHIVIDPYGFTGEPNVYAIGDVAGPPWLAHKAMHEGVLVVEKIAGVKGVHPMNTANIPGCTYCQPQVASIGVTEAAAKAKGLAVKVGKFPFIGNGKAIALGEPEGFIKTIFDAKTGELLGAHMIGAEVTELIQGYSVAKTLETTEAELMATVFPHPTLSEMMHESVLAAYGRTLHI